MHHGDEGAGEFRLARSLGSSRLGTARYLRSLPPILREPTDVTALLGLPACLRLIDRARRGWARASLRRSDCRARRRTVRLHGCVALTLCGCAALHCSALPQAMGAIPITSRHPDSALNETCGRFDLGTYRAALPSTADHPPAREYPLARDVQSGGAVGELARAQSKPVVQAGGAGGRKPRPRPAVPVAFARSDFRPAARESMRRPARAWRAH